MEGGGVPVHLNILTAALRDGGMAQKRTRHSFKKRNELSFRSAKVEIDVLRAKAAEGTIALAYVDEAGFSQVHPN